MVEQFSAIINELALSPQLRYQVGQAAIDRIKEHFLWDKKIQEVVDIYKRAIWARA